MVEIYFHKNLVFFMVAIEWSANKGDKLKSKQAKLNTVI